MNVYVESNFVLELALLQEQHASCEDLLRLCEGGRIRLVIPAYSIAEPYETLTRRHRQRKRMKAELDEELRQLARTTTYAHRLSGFQQLTTLFIDSADEEAKRLEGVHSQLLQVAEVIPLEVSILTAATQYQRTHGLAPQDALVYAAVLSHLKQHQMPQSCFLNRNSSATRQGWSKGIGGGDAFMKRCSSSSGCKARLAKGEPAQAGSEPGDGLRNGVGAASARERVGHGPCGPETYNLPGCPGC